MEALPYVVLGFNRGGSAVYLSNDGKWYAQHTASTANHYRGLKPGTLAVTVDWLCGVTQNIPIEWKGFY